MNVNFEAALRLINMESYEQAVDKLKEAIDEERTAEREDTAVQYSCVLGELLANIGRTDEARAEFNKIIEYCMRTGTLPKQKQIAQVYLDMFDGKIKTVTNPLNTPAPGKPAQNKSFISKQMRKRK